MAISADGTTLIVGGPGDSSNAGAAWVFVRTGSTWAMQSKLVGNNAGGAASQGTSVAISADGNTAVIGGPNDSSKTGAAWVFTRSGSTWSQQAKLVGTGATTAAQQGYAVGMSGDGNSLIVGGPQDSDGHNTAWGAAWVFTRSGGTWTQLGGKLVAADAVGPIPNFGWSAALSFDGSTAIIGGPGDSATWGAAWIFTCSNAGCTQQVEKLVATDVAIGGPEEGTAVAISADGNTAVIGGPDHYGSGWIFTQSGGVWSEGSKLVGPTNGTGVESVSVALSSDGQTAVLGTPGSNGGNGAAWVYASGAGNWTNIQILSGSNSIGTPAQGTSVAISANGGTVASGGSGDDSGIGAAWVFAKANFNPPATHDFNGNGDSDLLWRDTSGNTALWLMNGAAVSQTGGLGAVPTTWSVVGQRDFNGDGHADLLWRDTSGNTAIWLMNGVAVSSTVGLGNVPTTWTVSGTGDLNGDGTGDLLWRDSAGDIAIWFLNGGAVASTASLGNVPSTWTIVGDDNKGDIFWHDNAGNYAVWHVDGSQVTATAGLGNVPLAWQIAALGDFNGDGNTDIVWRDTSGNTAIWFLNSALGVQSTAGLGTIPTAWSIAQTGDYNGDGDSDIVWMDTSGDVAIWFMNAGTVTSAAGLGNVGTAWQVQSVNAE